MATRTSSVRNDYRCSIERNQSGKYCVRLQVHYPRHAWNLSVFFLAGSFDRAMKRLEEALDFLQRQEEKRGSGVWTAPKTWAFRPSSSRMRVEARPPFRISKKGHQRIAGPGAPVPAFVLGPMRRGLAESVEVARSAAASD